MLNKIATSLCSLLLSAALACEAAQACGEFPDASSFSTSALSITDLKCEGLSNPLAVDSVAPRLSWILNSLQRGLSQSAYQVLVASSSDKIAADQADIWDSGKVTGGDSINIVYGGSALKSGQACHWKVRVWDRHNTESAWSQPAVWEMAPRTQDWAAKWLNDGKSNPANEADFYRHDPAPLFRKEFSIDKPLRSARLHITGLGYYEASLNGQRIGDHMLDPGWTAYGKRILYSTYDLTSELKLGANCLGVMVGNGWYNPLPLRMWGHLNLREHLPAGRPRFIAQLNLEYENGDTQIVTSDTTWKTAPGPIRFNSVYLGEVYDARLELPGWDRAGFPDSNWQAASIAPEVVGRLQPQSQPPIRMKEHIATVRITEPQPGTFIHDLGQNFSGTIALGLTPPLPPPGTKIVLRYGELLNADGTLNPLTSTCGQIKGRASETNSTQGPPPVAWQTDTYITRSDANAAETYTPRFTFHGFRFVEVTVIPVDETARSSFGPITITGVRLNSDVPDAGSFSCSNDLFNQIQQMCRRTFLANIFSVQSDCPHRERFGYGGDIVATSDTFMLNFDMSRFYAKTVSDFSDAARPDGLIPDTAPFVGIHYCGVGWAMAHPLLLTQLRRNYGDDRVVAEHYDVAKRWLVRVAETYPDGIVTRGLSDHEGLESAPEPLMVTPLYVQSAKLLAGLARSLGRDEDVVKFESIARTATTAYQRKYSSTFEPGATPESTQASLAFALYSDLVPTEKQPVVLQSLVDNIQTKRQGKLATGILGTKFMLEVLSRSGRADLAYNIVNRKDFPGWGWMLENGATTLWEHWELDRNTFSHSHPMFGSVSQWFFNSLGGIRPAPDAIGFNAIIIRPQPVSGLDWVRASHQTVRGQIVSNWRRENHHLFMDIQIPIGATALVYLPATRLEQVSESNICLSSTPAIEGVEFVRSDPAIQAVVCRIAAGRYNFQIDLGK